MSFRGDRIRETRQLRHFTQKQLAAALGVSQQQILKWEKNDHMPSSERIARMAQVLSCTTDWLFGLVDSPEAYVQERELSDDERLLIDLYRRRELPTIIARLVTELADRDVQKNPAVDRASETNITASNVVLGG